VAQIAGEQDRLAYIAVMQDRREGRESTQTKLRGAARFEKARTLQTALAFVRAVERKWLREWSGMQDKLLNDSCERYGVPVKGPVWSVPELVHWVFRFLAKYGRYIFRAQINGQAVEEGPDSPWLEELRKERTLMERIKRRELERSLISTHVVRQAWQIAGAAMRVGCEQMKRERWDRAVEIYDEALDNAERKLEQFFADFDPAGEDEPEQQTQEEPA